MSFHWIDPEKVSFQCLLLMDRWLIAQICGPFYGQGYDKNLALALRHNPAVSWYCRKKAPETAAYLDRILADTPAEASREQVRAAERFILEQIDWAVVYVYPELMEQNCPYIYAWDSARLFELADFTDKVVLDVGAGTGRLTFAAARKARHVYASEPVDRLREFMREKLRREDINNVTVLDGVCECLPYEDNTFDIVMSGHVLGDDYNQELRELERVAKPGGWVLDCPGEDDRRKQVSPEMLDWGYECLKYDGKTGGDSLPLSKTDLQVRGRLP